MTSVVGRRVTVAGLGRFGGGIGVARWLAAQGADVLVTDAAPADTLAESVAQLAGVPLRYRLGGHDDADFTDADLVVASPAIPPTNRYLAAARAAGVPVTTEIGLFTERCPTPHVVGITGTKGKSTTTALLGRMLATVRTTHIGGNLGGSLLDALPTIGRDDAVVLELSSYMLHYLGQWHWRPAIAVVTLVTADHLDWHGGVAAYHAAKAQLVAHQTAADHAVLCAQGAATTFPTAARVHAFDEQTTPPLPLAIPGRHNQLNAQAAYAAAALLGVSRADAERATRDFPGLPHRLELVATAHGVRWYNDSIATVPEAAVAALEAFPAGRVIQIVGGYDKHLDMAPLVAALRSHAKSVLTIGTLGPALAAATGGEHVGDLASAVARARELAGEGDVVLLSPGCASYDQFTNFETRGDAFRKLAGG